jgi:hypothetical protein
MPRRNCKAGERRQQPPPLARINRTQGEGGNPPAHDPHRNAIAAQQATHVVQNLERTMRLRRRATQNREPFGKAVAECKSRTNLMTTPSLD